MDLTRVKLIATDMDGTLLNSQSVVSHRFFTLFEELKKYDIHFAAASGRQYHSIADKLNAIVNDITIIAENGAIAKRREQELLVTPLSRDTAVEIVRHVRPLDDAYTVICGKEQAYIETDNPRFENMFREYYHAYTRVPDLTALENDEILKIAIYSFEGSEKNIYPYVTPFEKDLQVKVSGEHWLDISSPDANKGHALGLLQKELGISESETLVFGDYNNDLEMMEKAHFSFAMENSHPNVIKAARYTTLSNDHYGVEHILEKLIAARQPAAQKG
ncbi:HAD family hydrolase [Sinomicrobium soli]|uniref:HAD family hydrolase n=1 Tax=Sinomicrobium sp. N-1-3-6 TaxID=2219864 RepID=UPI000DCB1F4A|nr:HAD family hydrolase [Sinomicrobium sp. N-1-3-6]RAV27671.1 Cof-type HAD-IIB family hydrolase [Sinomicrobium sp. N-1-3-6]